MAWIEPDERWSNPETVRERIRETMKGYPEDYVLPERREARKVAPAVAKESIVAAHAIAPRVMEHVFKAYGAMLDPELPLSRREHEMIATVVSTINDCFY